jgi:hypothetical protein
MGDKEQGREQDTGGRDEISEEYDRKNQKRSN